MNLAIFDIDGTLTDSFGFDAHYYDALSIRLGVPNPNRSLASWTNVTDEGIVHEFFEMHGRRASAADIEWTQVRYEEALRAHLRNVPQIPGASKILGVLQTHPRWQVVIATGNWTFAGKLKLDAGRVAHRGIPVVGCDGRPERTKVMEHALRVARETHGRFEHVVYVGDAFYDLCAARDLVWNFVGVSSEPEELARLGATKVLSDYLDVDGALGVLEAAGVPNHP